MEKCPVCKNSFASKKYRYIHIIVLAEKDTAHTEFVKAQNVLIDSYRENIDKIIENQEFILHIKYAKKYLQKKGIGKFKCEVCGEAFETYNGIQAHFRQRTNPNNSKKSFDQPHDDFVKQRNSNIKLLLSQGVVLTKIVEQYGIPARQVREIAKVEGLLKCDICNISSPNMNSLKTHIRINHTEYIDSIKQVIIDSFNSNIALRDIAKVKNLLIGPEIVKDIWKKHFGNIDLKKRTSKNLSNTRKTMFKNGELKIWCEGMTIESSEKIRNMALKTSKTRFKNNELKGIIVKGREYFDNILFERNKKKVRIKFNNHCLKCNVHYSRRRLDVHHIIPYRLSNCDFFWNLTLLCSVCHATLHEKIQKLENSNMCLNEKFDLYINMYSQFLQEPIDKDSGIENPEFYDTEKEKINRRRKQDREKYHRIKHTPEYLAKRRMLAKNRREKNRIKENNYQKEWKRKKRLEDPYYFKNKKNRLYRNSLVKKYLSGDDIFKINFKKTNKTYLKDLNFKLRIDSL